MGRIIVGAVTGILNYASPIALPYFPADQYTGLGTMSQASKGAG